MKTIFVVQGYDEKLEDSRLREVITFEVFAKTENEAISKCKLLIKKPFYRVSQVIEK